MLPAGSGEGNGCYWGVKLLARAAAALAASAANSSRPKAVAESPQPPSAASVSITQVRLACIGSPEILVTISVTSLTSCFWPSRVSCWGRDDLDADGAGRVGGCCVDCARVHSVDESGGVV